MKLCDLTQPEVNRYLAECNFTKDQVVLFELRTKNVPLEECAERMNVSVSTVNRLHKQVKQKIAKI